MLRGDQAACAAIISDDYTLLEIIEDQPLEVVLKDVWLKRVKSAGDSITMTVDDVAVSTHGDLAIAVMKVTESTPLTTNQLAITDVWRKEQDWRLIERHQSRALAKPI